MQRAGSGGLDRELTFRVPATQEPRGDSPPRAPTPELIVRPRARHASLDRPPKRPTPMPPPPRISPFELVAGGPAGLRAQYQAGGRLGPQDPPPPPVSAERVLASIPTFLRNAAIRRVSEEDARALGAMGEAQSERRSEESQRTAEAQLTVDTARAASTLATLSKYEPINRAPSEAQTVIPVMPAASEYHRPSADAHAYASSEGAEIRHPSININLSLPPPPQAMSSVPSAPLPAPPVPMTDEERAEARDQARHDRRCANWQKAGQSLGTLAAGLIGSVGLTLSACNCCTKASAAGGITDGSDQAHLMAGFGWGA